MSASADSRVLCTTVYEVEESILNVSLIQGISQYRLESNIRLIDISTFREYRAHRFTVGNLTRIKKDACDLCVCLRVTIEDPTSSMAAKEIEKQHLEAHNTAARDHRREMSTFITDYAINLTDEDFVPESILSDLFDDPLPEESREPGNFLLLS